MPRIEYLASNKQNYWVSSPRFTTTTLLFRVEDKENSKDMFP